MKIVEKYSHLNGLEFLLVHKSELWQEIESVIHSIDAEKCKTKISKEKTKSGKLLYSPIDMNAVFKEKLYELKWEESRVSYWVTKDERLIRKTIAMPPDMQKQEIEKQNETAIFSYRVPLKTQILSSFS